MRASFFDPNLRHLTCPRSFCVEPPGKLPRKFGLKTGDFCPEFEQFKHVLSPEFTGFENREPLLGRVLNRPIVEVLNIHAKLLTIEAKKCSTFAQITTYMLFQKMSARYTQGQYAEGDVPCAEDDDALWLAMRLGQLGAIPLLKEIVKHKEYRIEARQEAVRQLLLAGERQFLRGYCLLAEGPVDMWKTKEMFSLKDDADSWKQHNRILEQLTHNLPSYVSAIVEG